MISSNIIPSSLEAPFDSIIEQFCKKIGFDDVTHELKDRSIGHQLVISIYQPSERFFSALNEILISHSASSREITDAVLLKRKTSKFSLESPEIRAFQRSLSSTLTIGRQSLDADFLSRYIRSASSAEDKITSDSNHLVFGRRGAGKSSLLVFALRYFEKMKRPSIWVDMQVYAERSDIGVIADVLWEILNQAQSIILNENLFQSLKTQLLVLRNKADLNSSDIRKLSLDIKTLLAPVAASPGGLAIFIDDLHVIKAELQPLLLSSIYSFARGNRIFLKISAVEAFTRNWDPANRVGLETPNDAQIIHMDYSLTDPRKALDHIKSILQAHAEYAGIPALEWITTSDAISRLVWVAAGVPRDAINIFQQALVKSIQKSQKQVAVTSINLAAADAADDKMRYVEMDSSGAFVDARKLLGKIKTFCMTDQKTNAFLIRIDSSKEFRTTQELIGLRFLHVLNNGITPDKAGSRFMALLLDYGFYIGIRAAKSLDLFQKTPETLRYNDLRRLPRFSVDTKLSKKKKTGKKSITKIKRAPKPSQLKKAKKINNR